MTTVIGVRFRHAGKIYYFDPHGLEINGDDKVIVETARGIEIGSVALAPREIEDEKVIQPLKPVIRKADENDLKADEENRIKEKSAYDICLEKIRKHGLEMKLIECEYTFDNSKILFYFIADGRIDFRELVKDLASVFHTRIELRQIGVRDEAKTLGGIGICGRQLCCNTFLGDFAPVSIKMAKEQNISLNPSKISGNCGRLMCCLNNEELAYEELNAKLPNVGDFVTTSDGTAGEVASVNVLKQIVRVVITDEDGDKEARDYKVEDLAFKPRRRKERKNNMDSAEEKELKALEMLEKREGGSHIDD
ncbi:MAG: stage 0 sporulation family protein [Lachnospiraceae bacterium]|nr:stage 0 sporulation family protein [Lachnospiraceae bacterium]